MGVNAQTAVPAFEALEVLTAAEMTQVNTGIPVFATTTTRDAAFGGAGEKVLAEGQFAYIEATNTTQYYDGAAWQSVGVSPGLVLVKTQTIGSAVASVAVTDAFSATYENYLITVNGGAGSTNASLSMILGATTAGYYNAFANSPFNESGLSGIGTSNGAIWNFMGYATTTGVNMSATLQSPQLAKQTFLSAAYVNASAVGGSGSGQNNGYLNNTTQYTGFTISTSTGTLTGGTIRIYGYANS